MSCGGKYELNEVIEINESCGCHIHLSKGKREFAKKLHSHVYEKARKDFFNRLSTSNLPSLLKTSVRKQYFRSFSKKLSRDDFNNSRDGGSRNVEWNFSSERSGRGLEWRSFNVRDVKTWKDFKLLMSIAFETVGEMILGLNNWKKGNIFRKEFEVELERTFNKCIKIEKRKNINKKIVINKRSDVEKIVKIEDKLIKIEKSVDKEIVVTPSLIGKLNDVIEGNQ